MAIEKDWTTGRSAGSDKGGRFRRVSKRYIDYFDAFRGKPDTADGAGEIGYWRDFLFVRILGTLFPLGILVVIPSFIISITSGKVLIGIVDLLTFCVIFFICLNKSLSLKTKKWLLVIVLYFLSFFLLLIIGVRGPGYLYLLALSLIITLIIGSKAGYLSVLINFIITLVYCLGSHFEWVGVSDKEVLPLSGAIIVGINFLSVNLLAVAALSFLIKGLKKTLLTDRYLKQKAQESDNLKSSFLANISHEIRTPLNAILGFSSLAFDPDYDENDKKNYVQIVNSNGEKLLGIINSILDISVIESGQLSLTYSTFSLPEVVTECYDQLFRIKKSGSVAIELENHEDITITADRGKLVQVIMNLLTNALKFTREGKVSFGYTISNELVTFRVSDSGMGIPKAVGVDLFKRFYQVRETKELIAGTGLGLAICKGIVEAMKGTIWYESELGVGTDFYFTIPVRTII